MALSDSILTLTRQLYPTGRAFKMPKDGDMEKLHKALAITEVQAYEDALSIKNSLLPDNLLFTVDDATDWERRLALPTDPLVSLTDRKLAIKRKLNQPGTNPAKGHYLYLQTQLQAAGFNVYVYENRFLVYYPDGYIALYPSQITGSSSIFSTVRHGMYNHGTGIHHGKFYINKVVNFIDEEKDYYFDIGSSLHSTFYIGGSPLGTFANVPIARKDEFRQLILKLKPAQTVAYLFINFV